MTGADVALAFSAGVLSFASPCVLPLVPVYLSVTSGLGLEDLASRSRSMWLAVVRGAGLFILGFSVVFVALGLTATALGQFLARSQVPITRVAGLMVMVLAVMVLVGTTRLGSFWSREWRFHPGTDRRTSWAAPLTGAAFAFGWTPCIGPVLGSVLAIAASERGALSGGVLLATYSAGLAVPLLVTGLAFHRALNLLRWTRRHTLALTRLTGGLLAGYGVLLLTDRLAWLTLALQ